MNRGRVPARQAGVRSHNLALVLSSVMQTPASRADLAVRTGLTKAAVSGMVDDLIDRQLLTEDLPAVNGRGRPAKLLRLHPMAPGAVGVELNVDYVAGVRTDLAGQQLAAHRIDLDLRPLAVADVAGVVADVWRSVAGSSARTHVAGTGLAVPGIVDHAGTVLRAPNLPALSAVNIAVTVSRELRVARRTLTVDNEASLAALAELHEPGAERDFVFVTGEIGVGAGIVIGGELFRGAGGMAGELGHVSIDRSGRPCGCGGRGCVEQYAGQEALLAGSGQPTVDALLAAVAALQPEVLAAVEDAGSALGTGLAGVLNIVDVGTVVLGGLYGRLFDSIAPAVRREVGQRVLAAGVRRPIVRAARTGADAAVRGAAASVVQRVLTDGALLS